jgi:hypothetical protein
MKAATATAAVTTRAFQRNRDSPFGRAQKLLPRAAWEMAAEDVRRTQYRAPARRQPAPFRELSDRPFRLGEELGRRGLDWLEPGPVAQLVEQGTFNPKVAGSIPARPTSFVHPSPTARWQITMENRGREPRQSGMPLTRFPLFDLAAFEPASGRRSRTAVPHTPHASRQQSQFAVHSERGRPSSRTSPGLAPVLAA